MIQLVIYVIFVTGLLLTTFNMVRKSKNEI